MAPTNAVILAQGIYFVITGVWPILSIRTFIAVTGPKKDVWLVKTLGGLIAVAGGALISASLNDLSLPAIILSCGSALTLGWIDIWYSLKNVISKVYLADAVVQSLLVFALCMSLYV